MGFLAAGQTAVLIILSTCCIVAVRSHGHAHDEDGHAHVMHEKPSFRYSRQANEPYAGSPQLPETTDTAGHYGHSHGEHDGHRHGGHGHAHSHQHDDMLSEYADAGQVPLRPNQDGWRDPDHPTPDSKFRSKPNPPVPPRDNVRLWVEALGATILISLAPFAILFVVRVDNTAEHEPMLKVLLAFAAGGLLGDAFLHLIPHAILAQPSDQSGHSHSHGHTHNSGDAHHHDLAVWLWVLVGFCGFLVVEKFVRILKGSHHHGHSHTVQVPVKLPDQTLETISNSDKRKDGQLLHNEGIRQRKQSRTEEGGDNAETAGGESTKKDESGDNADAAGGDSPRKKEGGDSAATAGGDSPQKVMRAPVEDSKARNVVAAGKPEIKVAGYLNLVADCIHNFTDGLAIGASFLAGEGVGIVTTITVLFHEVPHEIGDYAILIQSGCSRKQAMLMQLVTALGALSGTLFSLVAEGVGQLATAWILPFTAGGFVYIAAVSVIPELLENSTVRQSIFEILALISGITMMVVIAYFE